MMVTVTDGQVVGEVDSTLWSTVQQGPVSMMVQLKNSGVNTMNYRFQYNNGSAWVDMDVSGTDLNNTLSANQVRNVLVDSTYAQVQMVGNASGGAFLEFGVVRYFNRASGGSIPLLAL